MNLFKTVHLFPSFPGVIAAESTRNGGVSQAPYASLNLGLSTDDDEKAVLENRRLFFQSLGIASGQVASAYQVHGCDVKQVETPGRWEGFDALITKRKGIYLTVTVADCTPILIYDPKNQAVAAIHAGWRGTALRIVHQTFSKMKEAFDTNPADCWAYIGTCIDECSYEVDADVADHFPNPYTRWDEGREKFFLDLKKANQAQLLALGLHPAHIEISPYSTVLNNEYYFSYRKEKGQTGRMLNLIGLKP
ncbi:MAG: peptidoglycan editing factor PgeF [Haliscomenobacter sp.]|nr:peptidoglycan editing factor PgeF [Haliscomenobacter sp.]MBK8879922.1 peptidoglycan editing factor PgeF [Haliscomenobacter sp.]